MFVREKKNKKRQLGSLLSLMEVLGIFSITFVWLIVRTKWINKQGGGTSDVRRVAHGVAGVVILDGKVICNDYLMISISSMSTSLVVLMFSLSGFSSRGHKTVANGFRGTHKKQLITS